MLEGPCGVPGIEPELASMLGKRLVLSLWPHFTILLRNKILHVFFSPSFDSTPPLYSGPLFGALVFIWVFIICRVTDSKVSLLESYEHIHGLCGFSFSPFPIALNKILGATSHIMMDYFK